MPVRMAEVKRTEAFEADLTELREKYDKIDAAVADLRDTLMLGYDLPMIPVDEADPHVFAQKMDYPPLGSLGLGRFVVTYHQVIDHEGYAANPMSNPQRVFTLLTITELLPQP